jgi:hypothetical protein
MPDRIKFHLDENISNAIAKRRRSLIAQGLRRRGINTLTLIWEWAEPDDFKGQIEFIYLKLGHCHLINYLICLFFY